MNRSKVSHDDDQHWQERSQQYWEQVQQLEKDKARLVAENKLLVNKKNVPPKKRGQWDAVTTKRVASDTGRPTVAAAITMTMFFKIFEDTHIRYFMGLSVDGVWKDGDITNRTTSLLIMLYAAVVKFFAKFDGK